MPPTATGCIVMRDGFGHPIITGAGLPSITDGGSLINSTAGCGCLAMNGPRPGLAGEEARIIMDGLL